MEAIGRGLIFIGCPSIAVKRCNPKSNCKTEKTTESIKPFIFRHFLINKIFLSKIAENITTNISQGARGDTHLLGKISPKLIDRAIRLALKTCEALGLEFAGVDIMVDQKKRKVYVIDVNLFPGLPKTRLMNLPKYCAKRLGELRELGLLDFS